MCVRRATRRRKIPISAVSRTKVKTKEERIAAVMAIVESDF